MVFESVFTELIAVFTAIIVVVCLCIKWSHGHFKRLGLPYLEPNFPFGNLDAPWDENSAQVSKFAQWYKDVKARKWRFGGAFILAAPNLVVADPELVKCILSKDFQYFYDRGFYCNEKNDPLSAHLLSLEGSRWRNLRAKLTPTFTTGKMKMMFDSVVNCAKPFSGILEEKCSSKEPLDIKDAFARYTMDAIGTCAFGLDCNSFENKESEFVKYFHKALHNSIPDIMKSMFMFSFPNFAKKLGLMTTKRDVSKFVLKITRETVAMRESSNDTRKDFMQLLLNLKKDGDSGSPGGINLNELSAQAFLFFLAGFETSSTTGNFCLYELSRHPEIQKKVREEIKVVLGKHGERITYEAIQEMKYLTQVIEETLRKYPPLSFLNRICTADYQVPGSDVVLKKGTRILISVLGLQNDPDYFSDPERFDPDRFNEENRSKIVPFTYIPFGEGPRICIGLRFGMMQTKIGLAYLLKDHAFSLNEKTRTPFRLDPASFILAIEGGNWLNVHKIED